METTWSIDDIDRANAALEMKSAIERIMLDHAAKNPRG
jgi:hypothetical protein